MTIISFKEYFRRKDQSILGTTAQGQEDFPMLEKVILSFAPDSTVVFDISGFELFGYSYSKQTIRRVLEKAKNRDYGNRYFLIYANQRNDFEDLEAALRENKLSMLASTSNDPKLFYKHHFVIGELNDVYRETLEYIIDKKEVTSGQMMKDLKLESVQAASKRISKLFDERLVRWEAAAGRVRNVFECNRIEP